MKTKKTIQDVLNIVENEGLGYAVTDYMSEKNIADKELRQLWKNAANAMEKLQKFLDKHENLESER